MNRIYRVVWNTELGQWVVASEVAKGRKKSASTAAASSAAAVGVLAAGLLVAGPASATLIVQGNMNGQTCESNADDTSGIWSRNTECANITGGTGQNGSRSPGRNVVIYGGASHQEDSIAVGGSLDVWGGSSFHSDVNMSGRYLYNLAPGTQGTDAVNLNQLKAVEAKIVTNPSVTDPNAVHYDTTAKTKVSLAGSGGTTLANVKAGAADGEAVNLAQLKAAGLKVDTNGTPTNAFVAYDTAAKDKVTLGGGANGTTIDNVKAGDTALTSKEAVNGGQLGLTNQKVTDLTNNYTTLNTTVEGLRDNALLWDGASAYTAKHAGANAKIKNLAAGDINANSTDAINGSQLYGTADSVAAALGGGSKVGTDGKISMPSYKVNDVATTGGVQGAIEALDKRFNNLGPGGDSLNWDANAGGGAAYSANHGGTASRITNVADATQGSDAVNKKQLDTLVQPLLPALKYVKFGTTVAADAFANGQDTISIGGNAFSTADKSIAIGANASASAVNSVAVGFGSSAGEANTFAVGGILPDQYRRIVHVADGVEDSDAATVGQLNEKFDQVTKAASTLKSGSTLRASGMLGATLAATDLIKAGDTIKTGATVAGVDSVAAGLETKAMKDRAIAIGNAANAAEVDSVAIGQNVVSNGVQSVAIGSQLQAFGTSSIVIGTGGTQVTNTGAYTTAIGYKTTLGGTNTVAVGGNIVSSVSNSVLLGNKTSDGKRGDNIVSVGSSGGERQVIFVKAGTQDTDAVNVSQLKSAAAAIGGGSVVGSDGKVTLPTYKIDSKDTTGTLADGITALDQRITNIPSTDALAWDTDAYSAKHGGANAKIKNLAAGTVSDTSTDAINGSQLFTASKSVADVIGGQNGGVNDDGTIKAPTFAVDGKDKATVGDAIAALDAKTTTLTTDALLWDTDAYSAKHGGTNAKIKNLAAGTVSDNSAEAINGSQLFKASKSVADVIGGQNGGVNGDGTIKAPTFAVDGKDKATVGDAIAALDAKTTTLATDALMWDTNAYSAKHGGTNAKITNLLAGTEDTDAVNFKQLKDAGLVDGGGNPLSAVVYDAAAKTKVTFNNGGASTTLANVTAGVDDKDAVNVKQLKDEIGKIPGNPLAISYDTAAKDKITLAGADGTTLTGVKAGVADADAVNVKQLKDAGIIGPGGEVQKAVLFDGPTGEANVAGKKVINVAAGMVSDNSNEAINGSQLFKASKSVADVIGGQNGGVNTDGTIKAPTFAVDGKDKATVGDAIAALDAKTTTLTTDALMWDTNAYSAKHGGTDAKITNLLAGSQDNDAVNVKQLKDEVAKVAPGNPLAVSYDSDARTQVTFNPGGPAAKLTNVAPGAINGSSKDAVNGSQLFSTANSLIHALGGGAELNAETGAITKPQYKVDGSTVMGVDGAIAALDSKMGNALSDSLQWDGVSKAYSASHNGSQLNKIINVADGTNPNDAINKAQLDRTVAPLLPALKYVRFGGTSAADAFANGQDTVAIGGNAFATADKGLAIGANASTSAVNSVAIGFGSSAGEANTFAVGGILPEQYRRVVHVADGVDDTDAATVGQLNAKFAEATKAASTLKSSSSLKSSGLLGATLASTDLIKSGDTIKTGATAAGADSLAAGLETRAMKDRAIAIGNVANAAEVDSVAIGQNVVSNGVQAVAIGSQVQAFGASSIVIGTGGTQVADTGARSTAIGYKTTLGGTDTVAIGNSIVSSASNSVLLGNKSSDGKRGDNIVSVGLAGGERQVIFVKAGTQNTDAVNVSQLKGITAALGGKADVDGTTGAVTAPKYTIAGKDYNNVGEALNALAAGGPVQDALLWDTAATAFSAKHGGANAKVTNLLAGSVGKDSTDAINGSQLFGVSDSVTKALGGTTPGSVNGDGTITAPKYTIGGEEKSGVGEAIAALDSRIDDGIGGDALNWDKELEKFSAAHGEQATSVITNVAAGAVNKDSTDAINGGQLFNTAKSVADVVGAGSSVDENGKVTAPTFTVGGKEVHTVGDAVTNLDGRVTTVEGNVTNITNKFETLQGDVLKWDATAAGGAAFSAKHGTTPTDSRITGVAKGVNANDAVNKGQMEKAIDDAVIGVNPLAVSYDSSDKTTLTLGGLKEDGTPATAPVKLTNVASATGDTDAVNLKQLKDAGLFDKTTGQALDAVVYDANSAKASVTFGGANGTTLNNVADGLITRDSRQAVNGGQIFQLKEQLTQSITNIDNRVTNIEQNGTGGGKADYIHANPVPAGVEAPKPANAGDTAGIAVGYNASASGEQASAMGDHAVAQAKDSVAVGNGSTVTEAATNSVALGNKSVADTANTVSVGAAGNERTISHVARGTAESDAATMGQMRETLGAANAYTDARMQDVWQDIGNEIDHVNRQANRGIAAASALINVTPYVPGHTTVNAGMATYRDETALGIGVSRWSENGRVNFNAGVSAAKDDEPVFRVGVGYIF